MLHTLAAGSFKDNVNSAKNVICAKTEQEVGLGKGFMYGEVSFNAKLSAADRRGGAIVRRAATDVRSTARSLALTSDSRD